MKRNIEIPGTSMYHVARQLNIGRTTLLKGLRDSGILEADNTPKTEYEKEGLFANIAFVGKYRLIKTVPTLRANEEGINFIRNLCIKNPEVFPHQKKPKSNR